MTYGQTSLLWSFKVLLITSIINTFFIPLIEYLFQPILSITVMLTVALSWALSTQFTKSVWAGNSRDFHAPYFMVWFNTNFMTACYPIYVILALLFQRTSISDINQLVSFHSCKLSAIFRNLSKFVGKVIVQEKAMDDANPLCDHCKAFM